MYKRRVHISNLPTLGAFETMRSYDGRIFKLSEHTRRLFESCNSLSLEPPYDKKGLDALLRSSLAKSKLKDAYIRLALYQANNDKAALSIIVKPLVSYPRTFYLKGVRIITAATKKFPVNCTSPQAKSSNFLAAVLAKIETSSAGGFEPLMLNAKGFVAEGAISNIFIVKDSLLMTSPAYIGILRGITRDVVLDLAQRLGIRAKEAPLARHDLYSADEVFLTSTIMEIMPVVEIDGRKIGNGKPGEITRKLREEFKNETRRKED